MKIFKLPVLGEGLQEAEIVKWHVAVGDPFRRRCIRCLETLLAVRFRYNPDG